MHCPRFVCIVVVVGSIVIGVSALGSCTRSVEVKRQTAPDDEPYVFESEGQVPPPTSIRKEIDRVDIYEEIQVADSGLTVESVEPVEVIPPEEVEADSVVTVPGYRVQLFATQNPDAAESFKTQVEMRLGVRVYIEDTDGMLRVRVGDCRTREGAEKLRGRCQGAGYEDAWIVSSMIQVLLPRAAEGTE